MGSKEAPTVSEEMYYAQMEKSYDSLYIMNVYQSGLSLSWSVESNVIQFILFFKRNIVEH